MGEKINNILKGEIISSVFYVLLGLCLILIPTQTVDVICKVAYLILPKSSVSPSVIVTTKGILSPSLSAAVIISAALSPDCTGIKLLTL